MTRKDGTTGYASSVSDDGRVAVVEWCFRAIFNYLIADNLANLLQQVFWRCIQFRPGAIDGIRIFVAHAKPKHRQRKVLLANWSAVDGTAHNDQMEALAIQRCERFSDSGHCIDFIA